MKFVGHLTSWIIIGVCFTMALPVAAAIAIARNQALEQQEKYISGFARTALSQAEKTSDQLSRGASQLNALTPEQACSAAGIDLMQRIDLSSTLLQAVGRMDGDIMRCSSFAGARAFDLGAANMWQRRRTAIRTDVTLIDPKTPYLAVTMGSFVGIVHKDLALSFVEQVPDLSIAVFSLSTGKPLVSRGEALARLTEADLKQEKVFHSGDRLVAVVRSETYDLAAVAAIPATASTGFVRDAAMVLIPLGLVAGAVLSAGLIHVLRTRASMPAMIRQALKTRQFHLQYQPVLDLRTGRTIGAEALLRWRREDGAMVPPDEFIPIAEQAGLIGDVTAHVLELLANDTRAVTRLSPCFHFAVNFSAADMHRPGVVAELQGFLTSARLAPSNLVIEATERSLVDVDLARQTMRDLRAVGIKVAIDDFGTGYSSLGYLAQLEVDIIKIDKIFVHSLGTESATSQVAARIIDMAKDLGLCLVAEGIETAEQARLLKYMNVDYAQGYRFGHPMPIEGLLQHLRAEIFSPSLAISNAA